MSGPERSRVVRLTEARGRIPGPAGEHAASLRRRGTLEVKLSLPVLPNVQAPHEQDEIYVIIRGRGVIVHDGRRDPCEAGDLVFVAAGTEHRFEDFTDDLAVWVVFRPSGRRGGRRVRGRRRKSCGLRASAAGRRIGQA